VKARAQWYFTKSRYFVWNNRALNMLRNEEIGVITCSQTLMRRIKQEILSTLQSHICRLLNEVLRWASPTLLGSLIEVSSLQGFIERAKLY
jgi:hypothetical protein